MPAPTSVHRVEVSLRKNLSGLLQCRIEHVQACRAHAKPLNQGWCNRCATRSSFVCRDASGENVLAFLKVEKTGAAIFSIRLISSSRRVPFALELRRDVLQKSPAQRRQDLLPFRSVSIRELPRRITRSGSLRWTKPGVWPTSCTSSLTARPRDPTERGQAK